ncbi:Indole-3-glycerol phosphate synthase (EC [Olavius algarvensis associated proteobacterium Delta 3]|nr:Indole-3-glycerol phosphate synthase (EC [Olavius algarvensis associated proteobacterium Delta 3]CAB5155445.1 Indole-3-glycerol phosphate synthase (EC [Olavius algarvensis associated proteobacterium Delta 3]
MFGSILEKIIETKRKEIADAARSVPIEQLTEQAAAAPECRSFLKPFLRSGVNVIAEIKRASPSKGAIRPDLDAGQQARRYQEGGAAALSVLTDGPFFQGCLDDLERARAATTLPVLRKDFLIDPYQLFEARAAGADAILLIVRVLDEKRLGKLLELGETLGMDALVEIHSRPDLKVASRAGAKLIGINNRDLSSFDTDIRTAIGLVDRLAPDQIPVAASGIGGPDDIRRNIAAGIHNFLIGECLVRSKDPAAFLKLLIETGDVHP